MIKKAKGDPEGKATKPSQETNLACSIFTKIYVNEIEDFQIS